jgi:phenylpropionate dioxygenase-like ring-hydroxylating dioxygenase large terminal subunit
MEAYHIPTVHGGTLAKHKAKKKRESLPPADSEFVYLYTSQAGTRALLAGEVGFPEIASLDEKGRAGSYYPLIYPSTMFCCTTDCMWYLEVHPLGPTRMKLIHGAVFPKVTVERDDFEEVVKKYYHRWDITAAEDNDISEIQQKGISSPLARPGRLSHMEPLVHTIGNWVLDRVLGEETAAGRGMAGD